MSVRRTFLLLLVFAAASIAPLFAGAQSWPDKPIKFIVAAPAGSSLDAC
jgi:tripartite-type tricarboxylate transporter receptor subunit TctC